MHGVYQSPQRKSDPSALLDAHPQAIWRADQLGGTAIHTDSTGYDELDSELPGGGWPRGALTELMWNQPGGGEIRLLLPLLTRLNKQDQEIFIVSPPHLICAPALHQAGIDLSKVLQVHANTPANRLWAIEQMIRSDCAGAILAWCPTAKPESIRRLQVAAVGSKSFVFLYRPAAAAREASAAQLRLQCQPEYQGKIVIDIIKRRGPAADGSITVQTPLPELLARPNIWKSPKQLVSEQHNHKVTEKLILQCNS